VSGEKGKPQWGKEGEEAPAFPTGARALDIREGLPLIAMETYVHVETLLSRGNN
jgi:hypothetical protein